MPARRLVFLLFAVAAACALAGCGQPRPAELQGEVCKSIAVAGRTPYPWPDIYESLQQAPPPPAPAAAGAPPAGPVPPPATPRARAFRDKIAAQEATRAATAPPRVIPPPTRILSVSAGGAWGAFSIGFLEGWGENTGPEPRPKFDVVTGVSTGSMIAPVIFLNDPARLAKLRTLYSGLRNQDVFTPRGTLSLLTATSLYDNAPLRAKVAAILDEEMVEAIAAENEKRTLAVMATNLDSGVPEVFDLTAIAARKDMTMAERRQRMIAAVMASAALPIGFPPEFIDNNMYVDGGVRMHVFFSRELQAALAGKRLDVTIVVSGDLAVGRDCTGKDGLDLLSVAGRTAAIATDQLLRTSVENMLTVGRQRGNTARYIDAAPLIDYGAKVPQPHRPPPGPCLISGDNDDIFNPVFQECLARNGAIMGRATPIPWKLKIQGGRVVRLAGN